MSTSAPSQASPAVKATLLARIANKEANIGVVGLGYVGLPFAVEMATAGFRVLGIERNPHRVQQVNQARSYIDDVQDAALQPLREKDLLLATTTFDRIPEMDVVVICVPTPLTENLVPNLDYVKGVTKNIAAKLRPGQLINLESTTYPGTTDEIMRPILEQTSGLRQGTDFYLAYSPERVDPGNAKFRTKNTSKVVGASDPDSLEVARLLYQQTLEEVVPVSSASAAEMTKVFENTFRAVNIALVNELAMLCDRMNLDVWEILDAAFTKPFGIMPFFPGPGVGGHCIPIDPHYLEWKAKAMGFNTHFIALAGEINRRMPEFVRTKALRCLNDIGIAPSKAKTLVLGVAYKKDISDCRESPSLNLISLLQREGMEIQYHDPFVPEVKIQEQRFESAPLTQELVNGVDLVLIATPHSRVNYDFVVQHAKKVLDTRGVTRHLAGQTEHVVLL